MANGNNTSIFYIWKLGTSMNTLIYIITIHAYYIHDQKTYALLIYMVFPAAYMYHKTKYTCNNNHNNNGERIPVPRQNVNIDALRKFFRAKSPTPTCLFLLGAW